jgi:hypothetical protein
MSIRRRTFLQGSALAAGSALLPSDQIQLRPSAFQRLAPGTVKPTGWLATQLDRQLHGLNGRYQEVSHYLQFANTGWTDPAIDGWEEVPYWLRGYGDLGYVTSDSRVLADTERWINAVLATQAPDGYFGPTKLRTIQNGHADLWPHMPMLHALRSWAEYRNDTRVDAVLARYFHFMAQQPNGVFVDGWGNTRWGDTIDVLYWLYGRSGDTSLLDLVRRIHQYSADWSRIASLHNVNFAQGFREPAQFWMLSGDDQHRTASYRTYDTMMATYGQFPGGGFAGDENARPGYNDPRQGFETCGVVEFMASHELLTRITGDPVWADRAEDLAFNMLPAALDPQGKVTHYVTSANSVWLDDVPKTRRQFQNDFAMQAYKPGVDRYRCCPHNYGQGWPYYVEEMWHTTPAGGVVATLYGPCTVSTPSVSIAEQTTYPFGDTITFRFTLPTARAFPFSVRIPSWCGSPQLTVNGAAVDAKAGPRFVTVNRTWRSGDTVVLRLPMSPRTRTWNHQAVSVDHGPLTFSVEIAEQWTRFDGTDDWPSYSVQPGSAWNVGLTQSPGFTVTSSGSADDPFTTPPIRITAQAQDIPDWTMDSEHVVAPLSDGPVATTGTVRQVTLIPMGAARLRLTTFPRTGGTRTWGMLSTEFCIQNFNSSKVLAVDGMSTADSAQVVQYDDNGTPDHVWRLVDLGNGWVKVRNENSGKVLGVDQMSTANSARVVQVTDNGTRDHLWQLVDNGDGWFRVRNANSGKVLGVDLMSTANSARVVQYDDNGTADHLWRVTPVGRVRIQNLNSTKVLGVEQMSTADSAQVVQFADSGSLDHVWEFLPDVAGSVRIRNVNSGKVLGVDRMSTANSARVVQFADNGTLDHRWQLRPDPDNLWRLWNVNSSKVLGVDLMSYADSAIVVQYDDNGTPDHLWRLI